MKIKYCVPIIILFVLLNTVKYSYTEEQNRSMEWFKNAKYGMFIHWGLYSIPAGKWKGKKIPGLGEWIMRMAKIKTDDYKTLMKSFNPVKFDPEKWVKTAKQAGMKYIVLTSKHHDGFAMFDTRVNDYDVVDGTPYGKDLCKQLADACRKHNMKLGFYYSHARDWSEPNGEGNTWEFNKSEKKFNKYLKEKAEPQVKEILTQYGDICLIWFDTPSGINEKQAKRFREIVKKIQPDCLINGRIGGKMEDYHTVGDNWVYTHFSDRYYEMPATMNHTWGFRSDDKKWISSEEIIKTLINVASTGGNYLLNVGPTAEGIIPEESVKRLKQAGKWLKLNGESIYGTSPSPFRYLSWGFCTAKSGKLYLHIFNWPGRKLLLPGFKSEIKNVYRLDDRKEKYKINSTPEGCEILLPEKKFTAIDKVIVLEYKGELKINNSGGYILKKNNEIFLPSGYADHNFEDSSYTWNFKIDKPEKYEVKIEYGAGGSRRNKLYEIRLNNKVIIKAKTRVTRFYRNFKVFNIGEIEIPRGSSITLTVGPPEGSQFPFNFKSITLVPVK